MSSNRIAELRHKKNMTLKELGNTLNMRDNTLSQYENNKREPKLETWRKLADFFDVSVEYLMGLSDQPHIPKDDTNKGLDGLPATGLGPLSETEREMGGYVINAPKPPSSVTLQSIANILLADDGIDDPLKRQELFNKVRRLDNKKSKALLAKIYSVLTDELNIN
ncbi:helix-turn-helix domain-containing protein [Limosilactobacillus antri]|uniref:helix-turn-helix domain-containing protein n=1 Tax=Limosilactobacillus antri TaxID=227943 RepID=UPI001F567153|nr:helix-turn-helix transcriptional regulator [Limosilactobacillus antri]